MENNVEVTEGTAYLNLIITYVHHLELFVFEPAQLICSVPVYFHLGPVYQVCLIICLHFQPAAVMPFPFT